MRFVLYFLFLALGTVCEYIAAYLGWKLLSMGHQPYTSQVPWLWLPFREHRPLMIPEGRHGNMWRMQQCGVGEVHSPFPATTIFPSSQFLSDWQRLFRTFGLWRKKIIVHDFQTYVEMYFQLTSDKGDGAIRSRLSAIQHACMTLHV